MNNPAEVIFDGIEENKKYVNIAYDVINKCYETEKINSTYISIVLTNSNNIRNINKKHRNIDKETDVLSFPMFSKDELENINTTVQQVLGDIIISIEKVYNQAKEYGHSFEREFAYMLVHGFYHLMGYDHITKDDKDVMRQKEEFILEQLDLGR